MLDGAEVSAGLDCTKVSRPELGSAARNKRKLNKDLLLCQGNLRHN